MGTLRNTRQVSRSIIHLDTPQTSLDGMHQHFCIAIGSTGSAFGVSNSPFVSTAPAFATLPPAHRSTGDSFNFTSAPAFDHSPTPFGVTSTQAFGRNPFVAQSPLFGTVFFLCMPAYFLELALPPSKIIVFKISTWIKKL